MSQLLSLSVSYSSPSPLSFSPLFHTDQTAALCSFPPFLHCPFIMKHLSSSHVSVPILSFPSLFLCVLSKTHSYSIYLSQPSLYLYPILIFSRSITACSKRARKERAGIEKKERREERGKGERHEKNIQGVHVHLDFCFQAPAPPPPAASVSSQ